MDNFELEKEAVIEVVGTQYDNRAGNHMYLKVDDELKLVREKQNEYDSNAILVTTESGLSLGYFPKGYASIYAPLMDSEKYSFTAKIIKTEKYDPMRPVLIISVISEYVNTSDEDLTTRINKILISIINNYDNLKTRYINILEETEYKHDEVFKLWSALRSIKYVYDYSKTVIDNNTLKYDKNLIYSNEEIKSQLEDIETSINEKLKEYQRMFNESVDIEDESEYQRVQKLVREKRKELKGIKDIVSELEQNYQFENEITIEQIESPVKSEPEALTPENSLVESQNKQLPAIDFAEEETDSISEHENKIPKEELEKLLESVSEPIVDKMEISEDTIERIQNKTQELPENGFESNALYYNEQKTTSDIIEHDLSVDFEKESQMVMNEDKADDISDAKPVSYFNFSNSLENTEFVLNEAIKTIMLSDDTRVNSLRSENGGLDNDALSVLIKEMYNKSISKFQIGLELLQNSDFETADMKYYTLKPSNIVVDNNHATETASYTEDYVSDTNGNEEISEPKEDFSNDIFNDFNLCEYIVDVLKKNAGNVYYQDGADAYTIKKLLPVEIADRSEINEIETILSTHPEIKEVEEGYYVYAPLAQDAADVVNEDDYEAIEIGSTQEENSELVTDNSFSDIQRDEFYETETAEGSVIIELNGREYTSLNFSDAFMRVCEYAVKAKPFIMARITNYNLMTGSLPVFCRTAVPLEGYQKISNGLQVLLFNDKNEFCSVSEKLINICGLSKELLKVR